MPKQTPGGFHWLKVYEIKNTGQNFGLGRAEELQELTSRTAGLLCFFQLLALKNISLGLKNISSNANLRKL